MVLNEVTGAVHTFRVLRDPPAEKEWYPRPPKRMIKFMVGDDKNFKKLKEGVLIEG